MTIVASNLHKVYETQGRSHVVLNDVSLEVPRGFKLALLGRNGAGKSTLIRLISKIELPTRGKVTHGMSVSWPLGFGGTFQGSLTGIDNVKFISRIYRADYQRLRRFVDEFAELGTFLYQPVKTYSSGMRARLAFALSIAIEFDCYLIDEVILVGDQAFQHKCRTELFERRAGRAVLIASHSAAAIKESCNRAVVLENGRMRHFDDVDEALAIYAQL